MSEPDAVQCPTCGTQLQQPATHDGASDLNAAGQEPTLDVVAVVPPTGDLDIIDYAFPIRSR